jgi:hypothetical protein
MFSNLSEWNIVKHSALCREIYSPFHHNAAEGTATLITSQTYFFFVPVHPVSIILCLL